MTIRAARDETGGKFTKPWTQQLTESDRVVTNDPAYEKIIFIKD
jgi:hypothetical protein